MIVVTVASAVMSSSHGNGYVCNELLEFVLHVGYATPKYLRKPYGNGIKSVVENKNN